MLEENTINAPSIPNTLPSLVMGPGQIFLTRVESAIFGLSLGLENFP